MPKRFQKKQKDGQMPQKFKKDFIQEEKVFKEKMFKRFQKKF
jgi:hypothetical protein